MDIVKTEDRWFDTPDDSTLCRMGQNGPITVTQIMPLVKFTHDRESFLDVRCGSGTTIDAIRAIKRQVRYKGVDIVPHRIEWLKKHYPDYEFDVEHACELKEADKSFQGYSYYFIKLLERRRSQKFFVSFRLVIRK